MIVRVAIDKYGLIVQINCFVSESEWFSRVSERSTVRVC